VRTDKRGQRRRDDERKGGRGIKGGISIVVRIKIKRKGLVCG
jgi:hypothetical protein